MTRTTTTCTAGLPLDERLPVHPHNGLTAIGWRRDGAPIWPVMGAADDAGEPDDDPAGDDGEPDDDDKGDDEGRDALGDAGKKALDRMRERARTERAARRTAEAELTKLRAAAAKPPAKDGEQPDLEQLREQARAEARDAAQAEVLHERVLTRIEARAARTFADPTDAVAQLRDSVDDLTDGGKPDVEAIDEALKELLEKKPHLAAQGARRFGGSADGGARKEQPKKPSSLQDAVAKRLGAKTP